MASAQVHTDLLCSTEDQEVVFSSSVSTRKMKPETLSFPVSFSLKLVNP